MAIKPSLFHALRDFTLLSPGRVCEFPVLVYPEFLPLMDFNPPSPPNASLTPLSSDSTVLNNKRGVSAACQSPRLTRTMADSGFVFLFIQYCLLCLSRLSRFNLRTFFLSLISVLCSLFLVPCSLKPGDAEVFCFQNQTINFFTVFYDAANITFSSSASTFSYLTISNQQTI